MSQPNDGFRPSSSVDCWSLIDPKAQSCSKVRRRKAGSQSSSWARPPGGASGISRRITPPYAGPICDPRSPASPHGEADHGLHRRGEPELALIDERHLALRKHSRRQPHQPDLFVAEQTRQHCKTGAAQCGRQHVVHLAAAQRDVRSPRACLDPLCRRHSCKARVVTDDVMPAQVIRVGRCRPARQVGRRSIERPARFAEPARDQVLIDDRAASNRQVRFALLQVDRP